MDDLDWSCSSSACVGLTKNSYTQSSSNTIVVRFADTSNDGYGGHVDGIKSSYKLWFETPWDSHMTVVSFRNGKAYDFCDA